MGERRSSEGVTRREGSSASEDVRGRVLQAQEQQVRWVLKSGSRMDRLGTGGLSLAGETVAQGG